MSKVYFISSYGENGSTGVRATLDKGKVRDLLLTHPERLEEPLSEEYETRLAALLAEDKPVDGRDLGLGWGGFQLHIVECNQPEFCPHCGRPRNGIGWAGLSPCQQGWAGDPQQIPKYEKCVLRPPIETTKP